MQDKSTILALVILVAGCQSGTKRFLGTWYKISGPGADIIEIAPNGKQCILIENGDHKTGLVYKDGLLMIAGTFPITYIESSGHIMVGGMGGTGEYLRCIERWKGEDGEPPGQTVQDEIISRIGGSGWVSSPHQILRAESLVSDGTWAPRGKRVYTIVYGRMVLHFCQDASGKWLVQ